VKKVNETVEKVYGNYPEKILQFGEGNFLRAFADWMINNANANGDYKGSVVLCQPISNGLSDMINDQNGVYTLAMRGIEDGKAVEKIQQITSVSRCINPYSDFEALMEIARSKDLEVVISNTTEAGISYKQGDKVTDTPPASFPAKVTVFLYERFKAFQGAPDKGLLFIPVELIDKNGDNLKKIILQYAAEWELGSDFIEWIEKSNKFTNTLVDRIVTGYPKDQIEYFEEKLGYKDQIIVTSEIFNLWVIEGKKEWADIFPIHKNESNVIWTEDVTPYKMRKVRILNGGHTSTVLAAYLSGHNFVGDFMNDDIFKSFLNKVIFEEVIPTLDLPKEELTAFADSVGDRFANPYIKHKLLDISLNSCSKFNARCLPSLMEYTNRKGTLPEALCFSFAAFIEFYKGKKIDGQYIGKRADGTQYQIKDDAEVLDFFADLWANNDTAAITKAVLSNTSFWSGNDLTSIPGLSEKVADYLYKLETMDVHSILKELVK
jgi:tagaturonate reductase